MKRQLLQYMFFLSAFVMAENMASAQQNSPGPVLNYYVDAANGSDTNDGLAWGTAFKTLSKALDLANANSTNEIEIHVAEGVYKPTNWANLHSSTPDDIGFRTWSLKKTKCNVSFYEEFEITPRTSYLIIASDGLWDVC